MSLVTTLDLDCRQRECASDGDLEQYSLQDALIFNGTPLSFIVTCPTGFYCAPGTFPRTFTYPPGTFVLPPVVVTPGEPIVMSMAGCTSTVTRVLPPGSTRILIDATGQEILRAVAQQQADCDARVNLPVLPIQIHLTGIDETACLGTAVAYEIVGSSHPTRLPITFTVVDQPSWLVVAGNENTLFLSGVPDALGAYSFTVNATAPGNPGANGSRAYTVTVVGIANTSPLADGMVNFAYSETFTAATISGTLAWSVVSGDLPPGLSLNSSTGELSGTASAEGAYQFTIGVTNGIIACTKEFDLFIDDQSGVFKNIVWSAPTLAFGGDGSGGATAAGAAASVNNHVGLYVAGPVNTALVSQSGVLVISPVSDIHGFATGFISSTFNIGTNTAQVTVSVDGPNVYQLSNVAPPIGTGAFTIPAGINRVVVVTVEVNASSGSGAPPAPAAKFGTASVVLIQTP